MDELNREEIEDLIKNSDAFCILPFKHILLQPGGFTTMCCMSPEQNVDDDDNMLLWDQVDFDKEIWQNKHYQKIRKNMINGVKSSVCKRCYEQEDTGSESYRNGQNNRFLNNLHGSLDRKPRTEIESINVVTGNNHNHPTDWDIRMSRLCNLKCRMCGYMDSSQIYKEADENTELQEYQGWQLNPEKDLLFNYDEKDPTYVLNTLPHVDRLKILGGEPTLDPKVQEVLDEAIRIGRNDIYLDITTNLTNVTDRWLESLGRFNDVQLQFSVDGTEKTNEYIRAPSKWNQTEENIQRYLNFTSSTNTKFMLSFHQTISIYNIFDFWKLHEWIESLRKDDKYKRIEQNFAWHVYVMHTPPELDPRILPIPYRAVILRDFNKYKPNIKTDLGSIGVESIINLLEKHSQPDNVDELLELWKKRTKVFDKVRGQNIKDYIPQVANLLNSG